MEKNFYYVLLSIILLVSCRTSRRMNQNSFTNFVVSRLWKIDTCAESKLVDIMLRWEPKERGEFPISKALNLLGRPLHKQYQENSTVLLYYLGGHPKCKRCPVGDLLCLEFDKKGDYIGSFIYFISDGSWDTLLFWYSSQPDSVSVRSETKNVHYLSIPCCF